MSLQTDLENQVRESYDIIRKYEAIIQTSDRPEERVRSQRQIEEQKDLIRGYLSQYFPLCERLGIEMARDIVEIAISMGFPLYLSQQPPYEQPSSSLSIPALLSFQSAYALVIGIASYRHIRSLSKTATDARDIYAALLQTGYSLSNVVLLLDDQATKPAMSDKLDWLARCAKDDGTIIIYFSGHGAQFIGGFWPGEYVCPVKATLDKPQDTLISADEFTIGLRAIHAGRLVVFLDCCHAGGIGEPKDLATHVKAGLSDAAYSRLAEGKGRVIIASCRPDEVSWELAGMRNSLFTHYLLKGLEGEASRQDGTVWINNLYSYVYQHVSQRGLQHSILKSSGEDFIIAASGS
jgi:hypothetical protein